MPVPWLSLLAFAVAAPVVVTSAAAPDSVIPLAAVRVTAPEPERSASVAVIELAAPDAVRVTVPVPFADRASLVVMEAPVVGTLMAPLEEVEIPVRLPSVAPPMFTGKVGEVKNALPDCERASRLVTLTRIGAAAVPMPPPPAAPFTSNAADVAVINSLADVRRIPLPAVGPLFTTRTCPAPALTLSSVMLPLVLFVNPAPVFIVTVMFAPPELSDVPAAIVMAAVPTSRFAFWTPFAVVSFAVRLIGALLVATFALMMMERPACAVRPMPAPTTATASVNVMSLLACKTTLASAPLIAAGAMVASAAGVLVN